ncbi:MAG: nucleotidyltransferase family protein [Paracoccaceae bacterium]|nr:MAG: nucleotidyltransferase family protein [Paracoccaceae bacterium]
MRPEVAILILAAGASSRMRGRDKLLERVGGQPVLRHVAQQAVATGAPTVVIVPPDRPERAAVLADLAVTVAVAKDARLGMTASLRRGLAVAAPGAAGVMILPADMPAITSRDLAVMCAAFAEAPGMILRGSTADGQPGHPVIFPADLVPALMALSGDEGGRSVIAAHRDRLRPVVLPGDHAILDLDTPEDWAAFRDRSGRQD